MIVVSTETLAGAKKINEYRENVGLNKLIIDTIDLLNCSNESAYEEAKMSSSNIRMRLLGKLLKPPEVSTKIGASYSFLPFIQHKSYPLVSIKPAARTLYNRFDWRYRKWENDNFELPTDTRLWLY